MNRAHSLVESSTTSGFHQIDIPLSRRRPTDDPAVQRAVDQTVLTAVNLPSDQRLQLLQATELEVGHQLLQLGGHLPPRQRPGCWSLCRCAPRPGHAVIFGDLIELPLAASATFRPISLVVTVCSSTADAMVFEMSLIWLMISLISRDRRRPRPWYRPESPRSSG